jgi:23S rRNA (adenine2030-N6)-methyltransferase
MALFGSLATVRAQLATSENFKTAFAYVEACLRPGSPERALLDGLAAEQMQRVELAGGVFALPQACMSQPAGVPSVPKWESHKAYIDVQAVIVGDEVMEVSDVTKLTVSEDLRPAKGFLYLDTHAGRGSYDLAAAAIGDTHARVPEWPEGVGRLWNRPAGELPGGVADYIALVREYDRRESNATPEPRFYPGSPALVNLIARPQERLVLCERQPAECAALREKFQFTGGAQVREADGYATVRAVLPPLEKRALVLIDPPFEAQDEWAQIVTTLKDGLKRLPGGVFAVWYPLTERAKVDLFFAELRGLVLPPTLAAELVVNPPRAKMVGCGLVVVNPPWKFDAEAATTVEFLAPLLAQGPGARGDVLWLVPER